MTVGMQTPCSLQGKWIPKLQDERKGSESTRQTGHHVRVGLVHWIKLSRGMQIRWVSSEVVTSAIARTTDGETSITRTESVDGVVIQWRMRALFVLKLCKKIRW